ncbi:unnamed protein product, partial [Allacma fusca]
YCINQIISVSIRECSRSIPILVSNLHRYIAEVKNKKTKCFPLKQIRIASLAFPSRSDWSTFAGSPSAVGASSGVLFPPTLKSVS